MKESGFRAWITAAGCWLLLFYIAGTLISLLTLYTIPVTEGLGIDRASFSLVFTMYSLVSAVISFFFFKILNKLSLRLAILIGGIAGGVGYLLFSIAQSPALLWVGGALLGVALGLCGLLSIQLVLTNWFAKRTGFIITLSSAFTGAGALIMSPVMGKLISTYGWRIAFRISGFIAIAITLIVTIFMIRDHPKELNLLPYGAGSVDEKETTNEKTGDTPAEVPGASMKEAVTSVKFWVVMVCLAIIGFNLQVGVSQQSAMIMDKGFSLEAAAAIISVYAIFNAVTKIFAGIAIDKFGVRIITVAASVLQILSLGVMLLGSSHTHMIIYAVLFGASVCVSVNYGILAIPMLFGKKELKGLTGFANFAFYFGCIVGPVLSASLYDSIGNYNTSLIIMIVMACILIFLNLVNLRKSNLYTAK